MIIKSKIRDYQVDFVDDFTLPLRQHIDENAFIIVDEKIEKLYKKQLDSLVPQERLCIVSATETNKTLSYCQVIIQKLLQNKIRKNSSLIAIGGGVIQDITAFISTVLFRGIDWIFFPTTLLAQADSCIGSKSSINLEGYKNLLGTFYPPLHIYIDLNFISTLPREAIKSGIGEIFHYYLLANESPMHGLRDEYEKLFKSPQLVKKYIQASLKIKQKTIEIDEFDKKERNIFNYGHTFGHAIEAVTNYAINHGQAVTMGMDIANYVSLRLGYINEAVFKSMHDILSKNLPVFNLESDKLDEYCQALSKDKKNIGNTLGCILTHGPGAMEKMYIPLDEKLQNILLDYFRLNKE